MIALTDCQQRTVYRIRSRNLLVGVFDGSTGFIGIREKFNSRYLFTEYHWDTGAPFGTVRPLEILGELSADIDLVEGFSQCQNCGRPVDFDRDRGETADERWQHADGPADHPARAVHALNRTLFDALERFERALPEEPPFLLP
jgi:hypothetical protein